MHISPRILLSRVDFAKPFDIARIPRDRACHNIDIATYIIPVGFPRRSKLDHSP
jgi:hypothetical protein